MELNENLTFVADPFVVFGEWFGLAETHEINDPGAMSLATVGLDGTPRLRMVLLKYFHNGGFEFFTNLESDKGKEISANPNVALCLHWKSIRRQVRITGHAEKLPQHNDDDYFSDRPRQSQIGAWASDQSRPLASMDALAKRVAEMEEKFSDGEVPRPSYWGGFKVIPHTIEFWSERPYRVHERMLYSLANGSWQQQRLYP